MPCKECGLWRISNLGHASAPRGAETPSILIVAEGPGPDEDKQGFFFVGKSGQLLESYLDRVGLSLQTDVRFENVVRCMPKQNNDPNGGIRQPTAFEIQCCLPFLFTEISHYKPKVIVPMGNVALQVFTGRSGITKARGKIYEWEHPDTEEVYRVVPTFHPAAVLRGNKQYESLILSDLNFAKKTVNASSGKERKRKYKYLNDLEEIDTVLTELENTYENYVAMDTETTTLYPWERGSKLLCWSLCAKPGVAYVIPWEHKDSAFKDDLLARQALSKRLSKFFAKVPITGQNIKFDIKTSKVYADVDVPNIVFDTNLAAWFIHSVTTPHDLEYLAAHYANIHASKQEMHRALAKLPQKKRTMDNVSTRVFTNYAGVDADSTFQITAPMIKELTAMGGWVPYKQLALDMVVPFAEIEIDGCNFNPAPVIEAAAEYEARLKKFPTLIMRAKLWELYADFYKQVRIARSISASISPKLIERESDAVKKIAATIRKEVKAILKVATSDDGLLTFAYDTHDVTQSVLDKARNLTKIGTKTLKKRILRSISATASAKAEFSLNTAVDVAVLFHKVCNLPVLRATAGGAACLDKDVVIELLRLVREWKESDPGWKPVYAILNEFQQLKADNKLFTAYMTKLPNYQDKGGFIHTTYNIGATATGRFSSSDPSFHTLPKKSDIKKAFVSRFSNGLIIAPDYSQLEMRVLAVLSQDPHLVRAFREGQDIHRATAAKINNKSPEQVTDDERRNAKRANFGVVYGQGPQGLADNHHIPVVHAEQILQSLFDAFPSIRRYLEGQKQFLRDNGCLFSMFGRRRIVPEATSSKKSERSKGDRIAMNSNIQATASEITAQALVRVYWKLRDNKMQSKIFGFIHDAITVDCHPDEFTQVLQILYQEMYYAPPQLYDWLSVPLVVDFEVGTTWGHVINFEPDWSTLQTFKADGPRQYAQALIDTIQRWDKPLRCIDKVVNVGEDGEEKMDISLSF